MSTPPGASPKMTKIFGDADTALKVLREYKKLSLSKEQQDKFDKLDYKDPNVFAEIQVSCCLSYNTGCPKKLERRISSTTLISKNVACFCFIKKRIFCFL